MRLFGFPAVLAEVNLDFMPHMREQKLLRLPAFLGDFLAADRVTGAFSPGLPGLALL